MTSDDAMRPVAWPVSAVMERVESAKARRDAIEAGVRALLNDVYDYDAYLQDKPSMLDDIARWQERACKLLNAMDEIAGLAGEGEIK